MRSLRPFLVALALAACAATAGHALANETSIADEVPARDDALAYFQTLPESNPYRAPLLRYQTLPPADREALAAWASGHLAEGAPPPSLSSEQARIASELSSAIVASASAPATSRSDWPLLRNPDDPDNPADAIFPGVGTLRTLARITVTEASTRSAADTIAAYAAVAQLGRQQRSGATLIEQLTGVAIEGIAQAEAAKRLGELDAEGLARLSDAWSGLTAPPSNAEALAGERDEFFAPILDQIIVPGLRAILANPQAGREPAEDAENAPFTRDLRLSGLISLGEGKHRVVLENTRENETFSLELGRPAMGIELVSIDYDKRLAVLRHGEHEALVHLESKRIVERKNPAQTLREMFKGFDLFNKPGNGDEILEQVLARARRHPGGAEGYAKDLLAEYQAGIDRQLRLAESPRAPKDSELASADQDPFLSMTMPTIGRVVRTLNNVSTQSVMLQAAVQHRLGELHQSVDHVGSPDPWGDTERSPFTREPTPDGGFILRSRYEVRPGQPLTYKFAAPDAGFVRPPSGP